MFKFYEVGGAVRDELLGLKSKDIDFVAVPEPELIGNSSIDELFNSLRLQLEIDGYEIFLLTPEMYTIRAKFPKGHVNQNMVADFVLARKELGYVAGTRKPIVVPGTLFDDLERRDFTINAIAKDPITGGYIDPFNGIQAIKDEMLITPINAHITFADDPLRLLRAIRFSITKGFKIHFTIQEIIQFFDYDNKFNVVSTERIREELHKCFKANTKLTLQISWKYLNLFHYCFDKTGLWLKPTTEL